MHAHALPITWTVRVYESDAGGFENREKWIASCVVQRAPGDRECWVSLLSDRFGPQIMGKVMELARANGFEAIVYERNRRIVRVAVK